LILRQKPALIEIRAGMKCTAVSVSYSQYRFRVMLRDIVVKILFAAAQQLNQRGQIIDGNKEPRRKQRGIFA
jgi:hypothetical protein